MTGSDRGEHEAAPGPALYWRPGVYAAIATTAVLMFGAAYFGSPFLSLHDLRQAARDGDMDRLDQLVDFSKVRENLKSKTGAYAPRPTRSGPKPANSPVAGYVTPDAIAAVVNTATPPGPNATGAGAPRAAAVSPGFVDLNHFDVVLARSDKPGATLTLVLERRGLFGWRLTRLDFDVPPPPSDADGAEAEDAYAVAKVAAADFIMDHPNASDAQAIAAATDAARRVGDPDARGTGENAASDARDWIATRKSNGFPPRATSAELVANDAAADAAERRDCARMSAESGKSLCSAAAMPQEPSRGAHYFPRIGACFDTKVASIATRLENTPGSGDAVEYADGHGQVSYDTSRAVRAFRVGDPIRLCVTDLPAHCPSADDRGIGFIAINGRTGGRWSASDAEHACGGA